ncbi:MAG: cbb3-type cytochrome oxidase assembly protein CcoS [Chromatiaceae bacterium]|jgi:cbb3-type cytochrome oxidase maturation protein|nr:cbb3-type cytochrome oxidase assembly protein CcoS [Chromatiaceae bacterium]
MSILYLLIPLAVGLMVVALAFFLWTVRTGQYDDLEGPAHRILMDDDDPMIPANARPKKAAEKPNRPASAGSPTINSEGGGVDANTTD